MNKGRCYYHEGRNTILAAWINDLAPETPPERNPDECPDPGDTPVNGGFFHIGGYDDHFPVGF